MARVAGMDDWPWTSASAQLRALRARRCSSVELVQASLERIGRLQSSVNAVVVHDDERALQAAREADVALARGDSDRPLLGLPVTVKESIAVAGLPTTMGDPANRARIASRDAPTVARLKEAGAILLGKSNVPLNNGDIQSYNAVYGVTNNPWDVTRTVGGSSGGSAACIATGCAALELGSDIGGSVRIPAHFCGVSALKPTWGLIDDRGNGLPDSRLAPRDIACMGPLARSAEDLALALDLLAGPALEHAPAWTLRLPAPRARRLRDFRVLLLMQHPLLAPSAATGALEAQLRDGLQQGGASVTEATDAGAAGLLPDLARLHTVYQKLVIGSTLGNRPDSFFAEARQAVAALDPHDDGYAATRVRSQLITHADWLRADEERLHLRAQWAELFRHHDIVLMPTSVSPAFAHLHTMPRDARRVDVAGQGYDYLELFVWIGIASLTGLPCVTFPVANWNGLPLGAQAMAPWLYDHTALAFARAWEMEVGGFVKPPGLD